MPNILNFPYLQLDSIRSINTQELLIGSNYEYQQNNSFMLFYIKQGQVILHTTKKYILNANEVIIVPCEASFSFTTYVPNTEVLYVIFKTQSNLSFVSNRIFSFNDHVLIDHLIDENNQLSSIRRRKPEMTYDKEIGEFFTILSASLYNTVTQILLKICKSEMYGRLPNSLSKKEITNLNQSSSLPSQLSYAKNISNGLYKDVLVTQIIEYMESHLDSYLTIDGIAQEFLMGSSNLKKIFKKETGLSVMSYFRKLKMSTAKKLILQNQLSYTDIASKLGFNSVHHFSNAFKKYTGASPTQYYRHLN